MNQKLVIIGVKFINSMKKEKKYKVMSWLFFGGEDKVEASDLTKDQANALCDELTEANQDSSYSGYYVTEDE